MHANILEDFTIQRQGCRHFNIGIVEGSHFLLPLVVLEIEEQGSDNSQIVKIIVEQFIKQGLNIDTLANGVTPLFLAMATKSLEIFEYLIEKGANVQLKTDGLSVLHAAQVLKLDAFVAKLT